MRKGQIEMLQTVNGQHQKWRWSHIHYQMCKKNIITIWEYTDSSSGVISYNETIPFGYNLTPPVITTGSLSGCKLVVELNINSSATINLVTSSIFPSTIDFVNGLTFDERILTDNQNSPYWVQNWTTQQLTEIDPNNNTLTGATADLTILQSGNNYSIIIDNYTGDFNFDELLFQYCLQSVSLNDFIPYSYDINISLQR